MPTSLKYGFNVDSTQKRGGSRLAGKEAAGEPQTISCTAYIPLSDFLTQKPYPLFSNDLHRLSPEFST